MKQTYSTSTDESEDMHVGSMDSMSIEESDDLPPGCRLGVAGDLISLKISNYRIYYITNTRTI